MTKDNIFEQLQSAQTTENEVAAKNEAVTNTNTNTNTTTEQPWSPELVTTLSTDILIFTSFSLILTTVLLWRNKTGGIQVLRIFGILSIVGLSVFMLIVAYDKDQLTPIVGLFGAIAGYLLGKEAPKEDGHSINDIDKPEQ